MKFLTTCIVFIACHLAFANTGNGSDVDLLFTIVKLDNGGRDLKSGFEVLSNEAKYQVKNWSSEKHMTDGFNRFEIEFVDGSNISYFYKFEDEYLLFRLDNATSVPVSIVLKQMDSVSGQVPEDVARIAVFNTDYIYMFHFETYESSELLKESIAPDQP